MCEYIAANLMDYLHLTFQPNLNPRGGVLPEKLGGALWHASETLFYSISDQICDVP